MQIWKTCPEKGTKMRFTCLAECRMHQAAKVTLHACHLLLWEVSHSCLHGDSAAGKKKKKNDMSSPGISKIIQILETGWKLESGTRRTRQSCPVLIRESLVNLFLGDCEVWKVIHREILVMDSYDAVLLTASFSLKPVPGCGTTQPYLLPNKAASF